jgi:protein-S-isoprenylcysteine O-methyltransferase Ste14
MLKKLKNMSMIWKFYFWPIAWLLVLLPSLAFPILLENIWLIVARIIGVILLIYSMFLASSGGRTLAKYGHKAEHVTFWPDEFSMVGIFSCMRHPMHLGLAIFPLSVALISENVVAIAASGWGVAAALWFVLHVEEKDTLMKYGEAYSEYMKKTPPFSLKFSCMKKAFNVWKK